MPALAWNKPAALARRDLGPAATAETRAVDNRLRTSTKLANVSVTDGVARPFPTGVTVNALDPGLIGSGTAR